MSDSEDRDRLLDLLLREELGGERPPDLTARIAFRAQSRRRRQVLIVAALLASAAGAAAALYLLAFVPPEGPKPERVVHPEVHPQPKSLETPTKGQGEEGGAGESILTDSRPLHRDLDGYCHLDFAAHSEADLRGVIRDREIVLTRGEVKCEVDRGVGKFAVSTPLGRVSVKGTQFTVRVTGDEGGKTMTARQMWVQVVVGAVMMSGSWGSTMLTAGAEEGAGTGGTVEGILTGKGETWVEVKTDGQQDAKKYTTKWVDGKPDQAMVATIKTLRVANRVKLVWSFNEHPRIESIEMIGTDAGKGEVTGTVTAKGENWIEVKPENGPNERYMPNWKGGMPADGGGLDKEILTALQGFKVGDRVVVQWEYNERKRVVGIRKAE